MAVRAVHPPIAVAHDGELALALGRSRTERCWRPVTLAWSALLGRLAAPVRTEESLAEFLAAPKAAQDAKKDVGGYVGGTLKEGRRSAASVAWRTCLTLDADFATDDLLFALDLRPWAWALHSTRKHRAGAMRLRLVVPLARAVTAEEYPAVARKVAEQLGIEQFDDTTYEPHRLMYWPSCSRDAEFLFQHQDGPWLDPDAVLAEYADWRDAATWPVADRAREAIRRQAERAEDPLAKRGLVGIFCRAYHPIDSAIAELLEAVYAPAGPGRYSYREGSTVGGLVVYEGRWAYSHHATDPWHGRLLNAWDLVRLHRFGALDEKAAEDTPVNRLPSTRAMEALAATLDPVKRERWQTQGEAAREEFGAAGEAEGSAPGSPPPGGDAPDRSWVTRLAMTRQGGLEATRENYRLALSLDPKLAGAIAYNQFTERPVLRRSVPWRAITPRPNGVPWVDVDDAGLFTYLESRWKSAIHTGMVRDAWALIMHEHAFHPVRDYLDTLTWDGVERLDTLFIRHFDAEDSPYTRAVARKALVGAVQRIYEPGSKVDHMVVFVGDQGRGKSSFVSLLAHPWGSETLGRMHGKEGMEALLGAWFVEIAELSAMGRSQIEEVKSFLSRQVDRFRPAYGRHVQDFPRQCVFWGTTNDPAPLLDDTGNRRFWPIEVRGTWDAERRALLRRERDQLWAEAVWAYRMGEPVYLDPALEAAAREVQEAHRAEDTGRAGHIAAWLEREVPEDWATRDLPARLAYWQQSVALTYEGPTLRRDRVCVREVWVELLGGRLDQLKPADARAIGRDLRSLPGWRLLAGGGRPMGPYGYQKAFERCEGCPDGPPDDVPF